MNAANTNIDRFVAGETDAFGGPLAVKKLFERRTLLVGSVMSIVAVVFLAIVAFAILNIVMSKRAAAPPLPQIVTLVPVVPPEIVKPAATTATAESQAELSRLRDELSRIRAERDVLRRMVKYPVAYYHRKVFPAAASSPEVAPIAPHNYPCPPSVPCER